MFPGPYCSNLTGRHLRIVAVLCAGVWAGSAPAEARVFMTVDEALARAFPSEKIERRSVFLTDDQYRRAEALAGVDLPSKVIHVYAATREGRHVATAYFDSHRVRTLPEAIMVVVGPSGEIEGIEVLSFMEPEEYLPRRKWYDQFLRKKLDADLQLRRGIDGVTGATLTGRATTSAVRRILSIHRVLSEEPAP